MDWEKKAKYGRWVRGEGWGGGGGGVKLRLIKYPFMSDSLRLMLDLGSFFWGFLVLMLVGDAFVFFAPPVDWDLFLFI